ncbi:MAG: flagellar hook assembly protein FlgD, partial [Caulobacteraceae bacterium]
FSWDGKDLAGLQRADGKVYGLKITATDAAGQSVGSYVALKGLVRSIETIGGQTVADINGTKVPLDLITGVTTVT